MQQLLLSSKACVKCWSWQVFMFSFSYGSAEQGFYWELQDSSRNDWIPSFSHHVFHLKVKNAKHLFLTKALIWSGVCGCLLVFLHSLLGKFNIKFLWGRSSGCCPCSRNHCFSVRLACMSAAISLIEHEARWVMIFVANNIYLNAEQLNPTKTQLFHIAVVVLGQQLCIVMIFICKKVKKKKI